MSTVEERREQRFRFLNLVFEKTRGNIYNLVSMWDIGEELGWDKQTTDVTAQYLVGEGLIKFWAMGGTLGITHEGVKEIERAKSNPEQPTTYFPAMVNVMSGDFRGSILNVDSTLTRLSQSIDNRNADPATATEIKQLIELLNDALKQAPPENTEDAEAVAQAAEALIDAATKPKPNKITVEILQEGLQKAAQNIASVMPTVLGIATQVVTAIQKLPR